MNRHGRQFRDPWISLGGVEAKTPRPTRQPPRCVQKTSRKCAALKVKQSAVFQWDAARNSATPVLSFPSCLDVQGCTPSTATQHLMSAAMRLCGGGRSRGKAAPLWLPSQFQGIWSKTGLVMNLSKLLSQGSLAHQP